MGLLDSLLGSAPSSFSKKDNDALGNILDMVSNNKQIGGLDGLLGKMGQAGLDKIADSWVGKGKNKTIKTSQLKNVIGEEVIEQLAKKLGITNTAAAAKIAKMLPSIIDKLTPDGKASSGKSIDIQDILGKLIKK